MAATDTHVPRWDASKGACTCGCICAPNKCVISAGKPNCYVCRTSGAPCPHITIKPLEQELIEAFDRQPPRYEQVGWYYEAEDGAYRFEHVGFDGIFPGAEPVYREVKS